MVEKIAPGDKDVPSHRGRFAFQPSAFGALLALVITKFLHTRYRVHDLEKTVAFYRDVLGLSEVSRG